MRRRRAARVVVAVPVAAPDAVASLEAVADEVVCVETTDRFFGISQWYRDFTQVSDDEVARTLASPVGR
jgi:putative phosphoribosyl transferase